MTTKIVTTTIRPNTEVLWYYETTDAIADEEFINLSVLMQEQKDAGNINFEMMFPDEYTFISNLTLINEAAYLEANNVTSVEELLNSSPQSIITYNTSNGITETSVIETQ